MLFTVTLLLRYQEQNVQQVSTFFVMADHRLWMHEIAKIVGISKRRLDHILHEISRMLTPHNEMYDHLTTVIGEVLVQSERVSASSSKLEKVTRQKILELSYVIIAKKTYFPDLKKAYFLGAGRMIISRSNLSSQQRLCWEKNCNLSKHFVILQAKYWSDRPRVYKCCRKLGMEYLYVFVVVDC